MEIDFSVVSRSCSQHLSGNQHHPRGSVIGRTNARGSRSEGIIALIFIFSGQAVK